MRESEKAILKDLRQRRKDIIARNFISIEHEVKLLESQKFKLSDEKNALLAEINSFKLQLN